MLSNTAHITPAHFAQRARSVALARTVGRGIPATATDTKGSARGPAAVRDVRIASCPGQLTGVQLIMGCLDGNVLDSLGTVWPGINILELQLHDASRLAHASLRVL